MQANALTRSQYRQQEAPPSREPTPEPVRPATVPPTETPILPITVRELFARGYKEDEQLRSILKALNCHQGRHPDITLAECEIRAGYLYYRDRLYVPNLPELYAELTRSYYNTPITGHIKRARTYKTLSCDYY